MQGLKHLGVDVRSHRLSQWLGKKRLFCLCLCLCGSRSKWDLVCLFLCLCICGPWREDDITPCWPSVDWAKIFISVCGRKFIKRSECPPPAPSHSKDVAPWKDPSMLHWHHYLKKLFIFEPDIRVVVKEKLHLKENDWNWKRLETYRNIGERQYIVYIHLMFIEDFWGYWRTLSVARVLMVKINQFCYTKFLVTL